MFRNSWVALDLSRSNQQLGQLRWPSCCDRALISGFCENGWIAPTQSSRFPFISLYRTLDIKPQFVAANRNMRI